MYKPCAQNHMTLHAFPEAPFKLNNWTAHGYQCVLDKTPDRMLDIQARPLPSGSNLTSKTL